MDLTELDCEYERNRIYCFLSVTWSIIADVDINSEAIRCCGSTRFTVWGAWRTFFKRHYQGSFKYNGRKIKNKNEVNMKRDDSDEEKGQLIESDKEEPLIKKNEM